ncbi:MAG: helix-turn-helix transcriptional regulator [Clostridia bacterium]|nr:helix-turn-helix transcriptional regulator [Clostridia bacterium]
MVKEKLEMLSWKIRQLRKQKKLTQVEFGKLCGVTAATVAMWENGRRGIDTSTLMKISSIFNVTTDWLLNTEEKTLSVKLPKTENTITIIGRNGLFNTYIVDDSKIEAIRKFTEVLVEKTELDKKK